MIYENSVIDEARMLNSVLSRPILQFNSKGSQSFLETTNILFQMP